jgi:Rad3-related DNA helicase
VGRLIRDIDDRGVLVICDNRLVMRPYGAVFRQPAACAANARYPPGGAFSRRAAGEVIRRKMW